MIKLAAVAANVGYVKMGKLSRQQQVKTEHVIRVGKKCDNYITGIPYFECEQIHTDNWISYPWKDII